VPIRSLAYTPEISLPANEGRVHFDVGYFATGFWLTRTAVEIQNHSCRIICYPTYYYSSNNQQLRSAMSAVIVGRFRSFCASVLSCSIAGHDRVELDVEEFGVKLCECTPQPIAEHRNLNVTWRNPVEYSCSNMACTNWRACSYSSWLEWQGFSVTRRLGSMQVILQKRSTVSIRGLRSELRGEVLCLTPGPC
jgi:hypothetical protein